MSRAEYYEVEGVLTTKLEKVQVSTMDSKNCPTESPLKGKGGVPYFKHGAFCLETQKFPDGVHHVRQLLKFDVQRFFNFEII